MSAKSSPAGLPKARTGIHGLDEITKGGLPRGRPTLICGAAGCGKTMMAIEFLVRGATEFNEPGVFMTFEENAEELTANVRSLGFDLDKLVARKKIVLDHVRIERAQLEENGEYDLEGLFIRLGHAVDSIGAKRVVLDTLESLFSSLPNEAVLRAELRRLFGWLKARGLTAVITAERGKETLTRHGLEEYVADCVILLDHRVLDQISTRRVRIVKYRGTAHGTNEYPFLITEQGISVLPITSLLLEHKASTQRVPSGVAGLDKMLKGGGYYRGSSILISGSAGTGKSSLTAAFLDAACARGERAILFAYEESPSQLLRNMRSVGIRLERWVKNGLLTLHASRPTLSGLEEHLVLMHRLITDTKPSVVVVDPISNLTLEPGDTDVKAMLMRLIDHLKSLNVTAMFTCLTASTSTFLGSSEVGVSSLIDTWLVLRNVENNGEHGRALTFLKSRGMAHSNKVREFELRNDGIHLLEVYTQDGQVLTGRARIAGELAAKAAERAQAVAPRGRKHH
jgi:circadian clock protein KaiC